MNNLPLPKKKKKLKQATKPKQLKPTQPLDEIKGLSSAVFHSHRFFFQVLISFVVLHIHIFKICRMNF